MRAKKAIVGWLGDILLSSNAGATSATTPMMLMCEITKSDAPASLYSMEVTLDEEARTAAFVTLSSKPYKSPKFAAEFDAAEIRFVETLTDWMKTLFVIDRKSLALKRISSFSGTIYKSEGQCTLITAH
ncbi:hypothetical protein [Sphingobium sp. YR768]|uniref:hypothetical protein n=1 Tax=Sphingobium sp. YR768 TaxID=1884365 RepID=UPI00115FF06B|nr:hypothetical protein [Sphingobium sp. YR768]